MLKESDLKEEELEKVSGGVDEVDIEEESVTTKAYTGNLPNSLFVDCPFCNIKKQFINDKWDKYNSFVLNCGCKLVKVSMMTVKIIKKKD